ncbi:phosphohistidine phosphatase [Phyllobacterium brassicacearum]|nr:phosphohistidine phosphatase [Phyllobacterium brassicacearum]
MATPHDMVTLSYLGPILMRRIILFRHAKSDWPERVDDHDRPLAERGRLASPRMGQYLAKEKLRPDLVVTSSARRARETWQLARSAFKQDIPEKIEPRIYDAAPSTIFETIKQTPPDVRVLLLVGHNPGFHELALSLIGEARPADMSRLQHKYPTAGLAVIDFDIAAWTELREHLGQLERFETPKSVQGR